MMDYELKKLYLNILKYGHSVVEIDRRPKDSYWIWTNGVFDGRRIHVLMPVKHILGPANE
jgi:hypothetical protein